LRLLFLYFSGTGNTDYVARYLAHTLVHLPLEIELRSVEWQPAEDVSGFDLLAAGFPVYAGDCPGFLQDYLNRLPPGEGRGAFAFCTKGAYAASALGLTCRRLAARGYVPLASGSVTMPGTDGLAMVGKDSWMARKALEKDYDHLKDADALARRMSSILSDLHAGVPVEDLGQLLPSGSGHSLSDRLWAAVYRIAEDWIRARLHADAKCEGCGLCARICPVENVDLREGRPVFGAHCVLCLRCLHACPNEAIQVARLTEGKFRWPGPKGDFRPLRMRRQVADRRQDDAQSQSSAS
jgi:ferredoxin